MKLMINRIKNAFTLGWWAFKNPQTLNANNFKMLSDLLVLILTVGKERSPRMTQLAYIHPGEGEKEIVSLWAGAGLGADPVKRIAELQKEISLLKHPLSQQLTPTNS